MAQAVKALVTEKVKNGVSIVIFSPVACSVRILLL